jgi:hypothetical protein
MQYVKVFNVFYYKYLLINFKNYYYIIVIFINKLNYV